MTITIIGEDHEKSGLVHKFVKNENSSVYLLLEEWAGVKEIDWQKYATAYYQFKKKGGEEYHYYVEKKSRAKNSLGFKKLFETDCPFSLRNIIQGIRLKKKRMEVNQEKNWPFLERKREIIEELTDRENKIKIVNCDYRHRLDRYGPHQLTQLIEQDLHLETGILYDYYMELVFFYQILKYAEKGYDMLILTGEHHKRVLKSLLRYFQIPYESPRKLKIKEEFREMFRKEKENLKNALDALLKTENCSKEELEEILFKKVEEAIK